MSAVTRKRNLEIATTHPLPMLRPNDRFQRDLGEREPKLNSRVSKQNSASAEERIEVDAFKDWHRASLEQAGLDQGFECLPINGGCALSLPSAPGAVFNRMFGLSAVDELEDAYRWMSGKAGNRFLQLDLASASDEVRQWLLAKGLVEKGTTWAKLVCKAALHDMSQPNNIVCRRVERSEAPLFGSIICSGFGLPRTLGPIWASIVGRDGWSCFFALDGTRPIGTGVMFSAGDYSWLGAGTVLPRFASRGAHKALIEARMTEGRARGTLRFAAEATFSNSATVDISYDNLRKMGFEHAYSRKNFPLP